MRELEGYFEGAPLSEGAVEYLMELAQRHGGGMKLEAWLAHLERTRGIPQDIRQGDEDYYAWARQAQREQMLEDRAKLWPGQQPIYRPQKTGGWHTTHPTTPQEAAAVENMEANWEERSISPYDQALIDVAAEAARYGKDPLQIVAESKSPELMARLNDVYGKYGMTPEARALFNDRTAIVVADLSTSLPGGLAMGHSPEWYGVALSGIQDEATVHELAHIWWFEAKRQGASPSDLLTAVRQLAHEQDPRYAGAAAQAREYVYGHVWGGPGPAELGNDDEVFAGIASGLMGDVEQLPGYFRKFYDGLFTGDRRPEAELGFFDVDHLENNRWLWERGMDYQRIRQVPLAPLTSPVGLNVTRLTPWM
jgi:hypothetical protein